MTWGDVEPTAVLLRTLVYGGAIGLAGSVFYAATGGAAVAASRQALRWQVLIGGLLILLVEPLRYLHFQLQISGGDLALAFDPDMRWIGMETPLGRAAAVRVVTALGLCFIGLRIPLVAIPLAMALIASFVLEGHTASHEQRVLLAPLLGVHFAIVAWWLAALLPIRAVIATASDHDVRAAVTCFGWQATLAVPTLLAAGVLMLGLLVGWRFDLTSPYQQAFALKLGLVVAVLVLAATNKLRWTPMLATDPSTARVGLQRSVSLETAAAGLLLTATSVVGSLPPS